MSRLSRLVRAHARAPVRSGGALPPIAVPDTESLVDGEAVPERRPYRPPIGIPIERPGRGGALVSLLLHLLIIGLILAPPIFTGLVLQVGSEGGAGPGSAGGGGGGNRGTGGVRERVRYLQVAPAPPPVAPATATVPPIPPPVEKPEVEPPKPEPVVPPPTIAPAAVTSPLLATASPIPSKVSGSGGGTGADGTAGSGPGRGGGVGSGVGTGRGSGNGPGTGGGEGTTYPPTVTALPILPLPVPSKVRPYTMVAYFDVDSLGNATLLSFSPSRDGGYNKRIREMLLEIRFRPAVRGDGRAVRDTAIIRAEAP